MLTARAPNTEGGYTIAAGNDLYFSESTALFYVSTLDGYDGSI